MSLSLIFGNFTIVDGERASKGMGSSERSPHVVYRTSIYTEDDAPIPALIRTYAQSNTTPLPDETVVFLYGKVCGSTRGPFTIEALNMFPYPGNPHEADHGAVPQFTPRMCILGHVGGQVESTYEGGRIFKVNSTAYVRDSLHATSFM
jgi:hypothetical protein